MYLRASCAAGLVLSLAAPTLAVVGQESITTEPTGFGKHRTTVAHWDGHAIFQDEAVSGLSEPAKRTVERWRQFAENRGYRIDLSEGQQAIVVSDAERFESISGSMAIVERVLAETDRFTGQYETPLVLLRASNVEDAETARRASDAMGFGSDVFTIVETGTRSDRRSVDARLAESLVTARLSIHAPGLSAWMVDGLSSAISEATTGRAIIDGELETLRSVQSDVSRSFKKEKVRKLDLLAISGVVPNEETAPQQDVAMALMAFLMEHETDGLPTIVSDLGGTSATGASAKYVAEEVALRRHCGIAAMTELADALTRGRSYRRR